MIRSFRFIRLALQRFFTLAVGALLCSLPSCSSSQPKKTPGKIPVVIVSISPYKNLVTQIGGDTIFVISALPPNHDPHTYEVTPRQMGLLQKGALFIGVGEGYEKNLTKALTAARPSLQILTLTSQHPITSENPMCQQKDSSEEHHHHTHLGVDPHFWLSLTELRPQLRRITKTLSEKWPQNRKTYQDNLKKILSKIDRLDATCKKILAPAKGKAILTSHKALSYFCRDYDLTELALECPGESPLPQNAAFIVKQAVKADTICAFAFVHHNTKALTSLAKKLHLPMISIDLLAPDALTTIDRLSTAIANALFLDKAEPTTQVSR